MTNSIAQPKKITFLIKKMDCPTEEKLIRNKLKTISGIENLHFNFIQRELTVFYKLESAQWTVNTFPDT